MSETYAEITIAAAQIRLRKGVITIDEYERQVEAAIRDEFADLPYADVVAARVAAVLANVTRRTHGPRL